MPYSLPTSTPLSIAAALVAVTVPVTVFNMFWSTNKMPVDGRLVVVTGGSQGMGLSVAKLLARKGANVAVVARDQGKLNRAVEEIQAVAMRPSEQKFMAVSADLTSSAECRRALGEIQAWGGVPDIVWTCAGAAIPGFFKDMDPDVLERQVKTNYFSVIHTAHAALNLMTASPLPAGAPQRHIIFTSSVMAFYPLAGYNTYTPAKAAIRSLADGLRQECILYNIDVHCCFPGTIYSPGFEIEQQTKPELTKILEGSDEGQTPDKVAEVCVARLEKGQSLVVTSLLGEAMRAASWGGSPRGSWWWDTIMAWVCACVWLVVGRVMDGDVRKYVKKNGVPVPGAKQSRGIGGPGERTQMFL